jgi:hypothetical protein
MLFIEQPRCEKYQWCDLTTNAVILPDLELPKAANLYWRSPYTNKKQTGSFTMNEPVSPFKCLALN